MGNQQGSKFGGILIRTENKIYFGGDVIKGFIFLHITKEGYQGQIVEFSVVGKEKTRWTSGFGRNRKTYHGKNIFHKQTVSVHRFYDEFLQMGQFAFPFELHLPTDLPGSYILDNGLLASLTYKLKARVISTNNSIGDIKNQYEIIFHEPIKSRLYPMWRLESAELMNCCFQKGTSSVLGKITKNLYFPNEFVEISYDIDNSQCKLDIQKIEVSIANRLTLRSDTNDKHEVDFVLNSVTLNGLQKGFKINPSQLKNFQLQIAHIFHPKEMVTPSTNGHLISSVYYVIIKPIFEGCTCGSPKPIVSIPITVLAPLPSDYHQTSIVQPENWEPLEFQPLIIKPNSSQLSKQQNKNLSQMGTHMQS